MTELLTRTRSVLTFSLAIVFLINVFINSPLINNVNLIIMLMVIGLSFIVVAGASRVIGYLSFTISTLLLIYYHAPINIWLQALQENLYMVAMFTLVPLLGIPIKHGGYFEALQSLSERYIKTNRLFYIMVSLISAFIGVLINLAVVPMVHQISQASSISANKKLLSAAISRGFATCTIWAPTTGAIALIIQLTGAKWYQFFPFGIFCGIIAGLVGFIITISEEKSIVGERNVVPKEPIGGNNIRKVIELSFFGVILISAIAIGSLTTKIHTVILVSVASLLYPVIWLGIIGRLPVLLKEFKEDYLTVNVPKLKNEVILFVGAGLFATSINYSQLGNYVPELLSLLAGESIFSLTVVVIMGCLFLSALGIHPIITVAIIGGTVKAAAYGVSPTYMALILAISWAMGISVSPSAATVIGMAGLVGESPIQVGLRWNGYYVLVTSFILIFCITAFRMLGLL